MKLSKNLIFSLTFLIILFGCSENNRVSSSHTSSVNYSSTLSNGNNSSSTETSSGNTSPNSSSNGSSAINSSNSSASSSSSSSSEAIPTSTISFVKLGGTGGSNTVVATFAQPMPVAVAPARVGYHFLGYYDAAESGVKYYNEDMSSAKDWDKTGNVNLYAYWSMKYIDPLTLQYTLINSDTAYSIQKGTAAMEGILTIPKEHNGLPVTLIETSAFADSPNIFSVIFESVSNIKTINSNAFQNCIGLTTITLPKSVTTIYGGALRGCSNLTSLTIPFVGQVRIGSGSTMLFGWIFGSQSYTGGASTSQYDTSSSVATYYIPIALKSVIITDASFLHYGAFYNCSYITSIILPESLTSIGGRAFYNCRFTAIDIFENVTSIGAEAFDFCNNLSAINVSINNNNYQSIDGVLYNKDATTLIRYAPAKSATSFNILSSVTAISGQAFRNAINLKSIVVPNTVLTIDYGAFNGCSGLTSISLPFIGYSRTTTDNFGQLGYIFGGTSYTGGVSTMQYSSSISVSTYYIPAALKTVNITDSTKLFYGAFSNCSGITSVILPQTMTTIGERAFYEATGINNIIIPNTINVINKDAFYGWRSNQTINVQGSSTAPAGWNSAWNANCTATINWNYQD